MEGDQLHVDIPEMLKELGFEDTEENRDLCMEVAEKALRDLIKSLCPHLYYRKASEAKTRVYRISK